MASREATGYQELVLCGKPEPQQCFSFLATMHAPLQLFPTGGQSLSWRTIGHSPTDLQHKCVQGIFWLQRRLLWTGPEGSSVRWLRPTGLCLGCCRKPPQPACRSHLRGGEALVSSVPAELPPNSKTSREIQVQAAALPSCPSASAPSPALSW